jgi:hypothetical protein
VYRYYDSVTIGGASIGRRRIPTCTVWSHRSASKVKEHEYPMLILLDEKPLGPFNGSLFSLKRLPQRMGELEWKRACTGTVRMYHPAFALCS